MSYLIHQDQRVNLFDAVQATRAQMRLGDAIRDKVSKLQRQGHRVDFAQDIAGLIRVDDGPELTLQQFLSL